MIEPIPSAVPAGATAPSQSSVRNDRRWLAFALANVGLWGVWGAFSDISPKRGFPDTLTYVVWAITMIAPAVIVMHRQKWALDRSPAAILYGLAIGVLGAGGQLVLFHAVTTGPTYLIFPVISLSPLVTIVLSVAILRERTRWLGALGVVLALIALPMFDYDPHGVATGLGSWFVLALVVMACWGVQAFFMKLANKTMSAESIFFYMMLTGLLMIPVALLMTDFSRPVNWGWDGPWLAAGIQMLNAVGALLLVYAFRNGKAIVVAPLSNAGAPLVTAGLALALTGVLPGPLKLLGLALALIASILLALDA